MSIMDGLASLDRVGVVPMPLTVDQYHEMIRSGILREGEPVELLNGILVRKIRNAPGDGQMTVGPDHSLTVKKLARLDRRLERLGCHMQTQQPVTIPGYDEPEPDGAVVRGQPEDYAGRNPGPRDIASVIEVADTSLNMDRKLKRRIYAKAVIQQYLIINLVDRVVEEYTQPARGRYGASETFASGEQFSIRTGGRKGVLIVDVKSIFP